MSAVSWGIWLARTIVTWTGCAGIAFLVADYVVKAHTIGTGNAFTSIEGSLDRVNEQLAANTSAVIGINSTVVALRADMEIQAKDLAVFSGKLDRTIAAVQDAGINIRTSLRGLFSPESPEFAETWLTVKSSLGLTDQQPLFIQIPPTDSDLK